MVFIRINHNKKTDVVSAARAIDGRGRRMRRQTHSRTDGGRGAAGALKVRRRGLYKDFENGTSIVILTGGFCPVQNSVCGIFFERSPWQESSIEMRIIRPFMSM